MTASELKRAASRVLAHCTESKSRMKRSLVQDEADVIAVLRAVAGGTLGYYDRTSESVELASDEDTDGDRLVIGGES